MRVKVFGKELTWSELSVGAFVQFPFYYMIGWWVLVLMLVSALLWAYGGASHTSKSWRRWGVPTAAGVAVVAFNPTMWPLLGWIPAGWGALTLGYGMPDQNDDGSFLGTLMLRVLKDYKTADMATRVTTYVLYWLSFILVSGLISRLL